MKADIESNKVMVFKTVRYPASEVLYRPVAESDTKYASCNEYTHIETLFDAIRQYVY